MNGFEVDPEALRTHANHIDAIVDEFALVGDAMKSIAAADNAYGTLCEWIPPILEARATEQDRITGKLARNLRLIADALRDAAESYDESDEDARLEFRAFEAEAAGGR
ncbi:type VII secretion target [Glycomyces terrestris]|uniref:type VII secretion target n=1 Tax=Glycomyces terrestris TaxID=2493553 RepID=UPI00131592B7|nr:type VII secretion target [Glycomyces terrestris]